MKQTKDGKVILTFKERETALDKLLSKLKEAGYTVSRATVARAKLNGYFWPDYGKPGRPDIWDPKLKPHALGRVVLTENEREQSVQTLCSFFGITHCTAQDAQRRGWFEVNQSNQDLVTPLAKERLER